MKRGFYFGAMFFQVHTLRNYLFAGTLIDFRTVTFTEVLMKDLARMLTHVHETNSRRVSFKMLLSICLLYVEKGL